MTIRWSGKRTLKGGRLEVGRFWFAWRGWQPSIRRVWGRDLRIGRTVVRSVGPIAIFIHPRSTEQEQDR